MDSWLLKKQEFTSLDHPEKFPDWISENSGWFLDHYREMYHGKFERFYITVYSMRIHFDAEHKSILGEMVIELPTGIESDLPEVLFEDTGMKTLYHYQTGQKQGHSKFDSTGLSTEPTMWHYTIQLPWDVWETMKLILVYPVLANDIDNMEYSYYYGISDTYVKPGKAKQHEI